MINDFRVGYGLDSHRFEKEGSSKKLILGGIIFEELGFDANSDGDVILHAIQNALSQAIGNQSISFWADKMCLEQGIKDSKEYLKPLLKEIKDKGWRINNIGLILECKKPKIEPKATVIKASLAKILDLSEDRISIQATTGEGLSAFGQGLGVECHVIVSLVK